MNIATDLTLKDYFRITRKRRWVIIVTMLVICIAVYWQIIQEIPSYATKAGVKVEQITTTIDALQQMLTYSSSDFLETQRQVIVSDPVFERIGYRAGFIHRKWLEKARQDFDDRFEKTEVDPKIGSLLKKANAQLKLWEEVAGTAQNQESISEKDDKTKIQNIVRRLRGSPGAEKVTAEIDAKASILWVTVTRAQPSKYTGSADTRKYVQLLADLVVEEYKKESEYQGTEASRKHQAEVEDKIGNLKGEIEKIRAQLRDLGIPDDPTFVLRDLDTKLLPLKSQFLQLDTQLNEDEKRINYLDAIKKDIETLYKKYENNLIELTQVTEDSKKVRVRASDLNRNFPGVYNSDINLQDLLEEMRSYEETIENFLRTRTIFHPTVQQSQGLLVALTRRTVGRLYQLIVEAWLRESERLNPIRDRRTELAREIAGLTDQADHTSANAEEYRQLKDDLSLKEDTYKQLQPEELKILARQLAGSGNVEVVNWAEEAQEENTYKFMKVIAGSVVGLILGFILAFIIESLDTSLDTVSDLEAYLGVPVLGIIPNLEGKRIEGLVISLKNRFMDYLRFRFFSISPQGPVAPLIAHDPRSTMAEAMKSLRTNLMIQTQLKRKEEGLTTSGVSNERGVCFVITSTIPQEGKTTIIANLAIAIAQLGKKILLIDADWRRPSLHDVFGVERSPGITDVLIDASSKSDAIRSATDLLFGTLKLEGLLNMPGIDHLQLLPAGMKPSTPSELLASREMTHLLDELREEYDVILVDLPPVLPVTDAVVLGPQTDGVLLVYRAGKATRQAPRRAIDMLVKSGAEVLGVVLNDAKPEVDPDVKYINYSYYKNQERA
ncbi:AAA family ATPase [Candidatus Poribacteria bacterium]|nr:AAA family ATPase [Candidatus Poribacteria bacterium]